MTEAMDNRTGGEQLGSFQNTFCRRLTRSAYSLPFLLDRMKEVEDVVATLKIDGTSSTFTLRMVSCTHVDATSNTDQEMGACTGK